MKILEGQKYFHRGECYENWLTLEWSLLWRTRSCHIGVELNGVEDQGILFSFAIPFLFSFYVGIQLPWINRLMPTRMSKDYGELPDSKSIRLSVHHSGIWWVIWQDQDEWSSDIPWWRYGSFHPLDLLFGSYVYANLEGLAEKHILKMPEGSYEVGVIESQHIGGRKRLPFRQKTFTVEMEFSPAVPLPGKGTSAWNCDDDAIYSKSIRSDGKSGAVYAIKEFRKKMMLDRLRLGGPNWAPSEGWPVSQGKRSL